MLHYTSGLALKTFLSRIPDLKEQSLDLDRLLCVIGQHGIMVPQKGEYYICVPLEFKVGPALFTLRNGLCFVCALCSYN